MRLDDGNGERRKQPQMNPPGEPGPSGKPGNMKSAVNVVGCGDTTAVLYLGTCACSRDLKAASGPAEPDSRLLTVALMSASMFSTASAPGSSP